jgi:hypothetical protein
VKDVRFDDDRREAGQRKTDVVRERRRTWSENDDARGSRTTYVVREREDALRRAVAAEGVRP